MFTIINRMKRKLLEENIRAKFKEKKKTLSLAESCTGGLASSRITDISGSSRYFTGSIISYANSAKINLLGVSKERIKKHGAVSGEVALDMALGVREKFSSSVGASITGIAGPTGGSARKPVGLAYMAFVSGKKKITKKVLFKGERTSIKKKFSSALLKFILDSV